MPSFRCQYLNKWLHKGQISQEEYDKAIKKLDGHDRQIRAEVIDECIKLANSRFWLTMPQLTQAMEQLKGAENE